MNNCDETKDHWVWFAQSYLSMARLGCEEMINNRYQESRFKNGTSRNSYKITTIFIPTFYNIKHGIEIAIKALEVILVEKLPEAYKGHDLFVLFSLLKGEMAKHQIADSIQRGCDADPNDVDLSIAAQKEETRDEFFVDMGQLVMKYYHCSIFRDKLGMDFTIADVDNTAFRYPENGMKIDVDYLEVVQRILPKDIQEMKSDIDKLLESFNTLGYIYSAYRQLIKGREGGM